MTIVESNVFSQLVGANAQFLSAALELINTQGLSSLEPLRQALANGSVVVRLGAVGEIREGASAIYVDAKNDNGVHSPGAAVLRLEELQSTSDRNILAFVDNLLHEAVGHGSPNAVDARQVARTQLAQGTGSFTQRADSYTASLLDDETSARYVSYKFHTELADLNSPIASKYKTANRISLNHDEIYIQFGLLEKEANRRSLDGEDRFEFFIESARQGMAAYDNRSYVHSAFEYIVATLQLAGTPTAQAYLDHTKQVWGAPGFEMSEPVIYDDNSSSASIIYENGNRVDFVFDSSGNIYERTETTAEHGSNGRVVVTTIYSPESGQPDQIRVQIDEVGGNVSATYELDSLGNWAPISWAQDGQTFTGTDVSSFIQNIEGNTNASDAVNLQNITLSKLSQLISGASGDSVAGVTAANNSGASLDTLAARLGMPYVSDRWAPSFLSGQLSPQLLLANTAGSLVNQGLSQIAQSRISLLQDQPTVWTVRVNGFAGGLALPLVLDLDDDGLELVSIDRSDAFFDIDASGNSKVVGWVGSRDGILVLDKNGNGVVDSAAEWFGQQFATSGTPPPDQDGFQALATLAIAGVGVLSDDTSLVNLSTGKRYFDELQVWIDANQDGKTDAGELRSLSSLGITSIDLIGQAVNKNSNGNVILTSAGYTTSNGIQHTVSDVGLSTALPIHTDGVRPISAAALAFAEYASKGYAAMSMGQAQAIATTVQGFAATEQDAINALVNRFVSPNPAPFSPAWFDLKLRMDWAVDAGLPQTGMNNKIAYYYGPDGATGTRVINTAPTDIIDVLAGIGSLRSGESTAVNSIVSAAYAQSDAQTKAQVANAMQTESARANARISAGSAANAWNSAIVGYLDVKAQLDGMSARLPAIESKLNELVPGNINLANHLLNGATFLTSADAAMAAEAFRAHAAILQPLAMLKVTGDEMLGAITQSNGYTRTYVGQTGQTVAVENGYNLLLGNRGSQSFILAAGVDNIVVTSATGDITVSGFQVGASGDRIQYMSVNSGSSLRIRSDGNGNTILIHDNKTVTLLGIDPTSLNLFANLSGVATAAFENSVPGTHSIQGTEVFDGLEHISTLSASAGLGDTLIGGERGSTLLGNTGDDTFLVTGRDYRIVGGGGADTVSYVRSSIGISLNLFTDLVYNAGLATYVSNGQDNLGNKVSNVWNFVGSSLNDVLKIWGPNTDDRLEGGKGNDMLSGGVGGDTYFFTAGDGKDIIEELGVSYETDVVSFAPGVLAAETTISRDGEDFLISYGLGDTIAVRAAFDLDNPRSIEQIRFSDGIVWNAAKIAEMLTAHIVVKSPAAQSAIEDVAWSYIIPAETFETTDGTTLILSVTTQDGDPLPPWLVFNAESRTFAGTPLNEYAGDLSLKIIATDPSGNSKSTNLDVFIGNVNDAPSVSTAATVQETQAEAQWSYVIPDDMFFDVDVGDHLTFSVTLGDGSALPTWLNFNAATKTLAGEASAGDVGELNFLLVATDRAGANATQTLQLVVTPPPTGIILIGGDGQDFLVGTDGADTLDGRYGADTMSGGTGDDLYYVDNQQDVVVEHVNSGTDTIHASLFQGNYFLPNNVENLIATHAAGGDDVATIFGNTSNNVIFSDGEEYDYRRWTIEIHGGDGDDILTIRNSSSTWLYGDAGNDILDGSHLRDSLIGGAGNDTYLFGRGSGIDTILADDDLQGEVDTIRFGPGISSDQLWFRQNGQSLQISIIGSNESITMIRVQDVERFATSDGKTLSDSNVQNLVQAMAAFSPPAAGQTTLPSSYEASLSAVIAANWQ